MQEWKNIYAFLLLAPLIAAYAYFYYAKNKKVASLQFSSLRVFKNVPKNFRSYLVELPQILKFLSMVFLIIALARPQEADSKVKRNIEGIDIVIALDVSDSMLIEDMKPLNRLEAAKDTIKKFIEKRSSDRIGLIVFAGESFTLVPPTLDYQMILDRAAEIDTAANAHIKDGTAIGVALANAAGRLKDSNAKSRVIIFMTDGENNSGTIDPETALEIAKGYGIKIYSIGIGKDGPTRIPIYQRDVFGQKFKTYQPFQSTVNEELLGKMASETGGKYYRASKEDSLKGVFDEINSLEKTKIDVNKYTRYKEKYKNYLLIAILLYFASVILSYTWLRRTP